jgi:cytoskeletal protein CcmA (bactofilin family)
MSVPKTLPGGLDGTTIGGQIQVSGRIEGQEDLRVEGRIDGAISLTETVFVEETGVVVAEIEARDVVVSGIVIGDVTATNSVTLNSGAKLVGNISAPRLIISDGAAFRGEVKMGDAPPVERRRGAAARAVTRTETPAAKSVPPRRAAATPRPTARPAAPPRAARPAAPPAGEDEEVTVVIKHAALRRGEAAPAAPPAAPAAARRPAAAKAGRARVPARGKRRVGRRG